MGVKNRVRQKDYEGFQERWRVNRKVSGWVRGRALR